jgi:hypothetical protein
VTRTEFEPLSASNRQGGAPDELLSLMQRVGGYRLTPEEQEENTDSITAPPHSRLHKS